MKESNANENVSWKKTQLHRFSVENLSLAKQVNFTWNCRNAAIKIRDFDGLNIIVASCSRRNSESISLLYLADGNCTEGKCTEGEPHGKQAFSVMCCVIVTSMQPFSQMLSTATTMKSICNQPSQSLLKSHRSSLTFIVPHFSSMRGSGLDKHPSVMDSKALNLFKGLIFFEGLSYKRDLTLKTNHGLKDNADMRPQAMQL